MTTILADFKLGIIVADSGVTDGDRQWRGQKVHRINGALLAFAGQVDEVPAFLSWWRDGCLTSPPPKFENSYALVMTERGLVSYSGSCTPMPITSGIEAIGSGAKAAMCAYEALAFTAPAYAVRLVCEHDARSRKPVRVYKLGKPK